MTANFLENQRVSRRRNPSLSHKSRRQQAVFGPDFFGTMKQKPAHIKRPQRHASGFRLPFAFRKSEKKPAPASQKIGPRERPQAEKRGFSFPVPSLASLAVVAGTLLVSLLVLNWEGLSLSQPEAYAFQPGPDSEAERNLASYAGLSLGAAAETGTLAAPLPAQNPESPDEIPLDLMETFRWQDYRVQRGDSVSKIGAKFGVSMDAIITSNDIRNARRLREGENLRIPNIDGIPHTVKKGDSLSGIAKIYAVPLEVILDVNDIRSDAIKEGEILFVPGAKMTPEALKLALGEMFIYPVRKRITSPFGWRADPFTGVRSFHAALDLAGSIGTPVKAAMDGTVSSVSVNRIYGNFIILSHAGGYQTLYAHLSAASVKKGDRVGQGSKIGEVGNTGLSTGPHLHFGVFKNGKAVNPLDLLQ